MDNETLVLDLVEWIADQPRAYDDVMAAWRTSCPRLTIWEDAIDAGLISVGFGTESQKIVSVSEEGEQFLQRAGRWPISRSVEAGLKGLHN